jgi:hypothetical protein
VIVHVFDEAGHQVKIFEGPEEDVVHNVPDGHTHEIVTHDRVRLFTQPLTPHMPSPAP